MELQVLITLCVLFFGVATFYTTVGHAGASGYLAMMALLSVAPETMRPTALALNILVAGITVYRFRQARFYSWAGLWPFLLGSAPFAALGGIQTLSHGDYRRLVGIVLLLSAAYFVWRALSTRPPLAENVVSVRRLPAVLIGAGIGFVSGLTGTGGGIFLSPILLLLGWAGPKTTAGISAPFILVNSVVALVASSASMRFLPPELPWLALSAMGGAAVGTWLGLQKLGQRGLLITLAAVMALAGVKFVASA